MTSPLTEDIVAELRERLDRLESIQLITALHNDYVRDLADRNWAGVAQAYSDDAVCDIRNHGVHLGKAAILEMFDEELLPVVHSRDGYILSSPNLTVDGDTAHGTWTWHRLQADFKTALGMMRVWGPWSEGKYVVDYERINGEWKIVKLWFRVHAPDRDEDIAQMDAEQRVIGGGYGRQ